MNCVRGLVALLVLGGLAATADAQGLVPWGPYASGGVALGGGFAFGRHRRHHLSIALGGAYFGPCGYGAPWGNSFSYVSIATPPPPVVFVPPPDFGLPLPLEPPPEIEVEVGPRPVPGQVAGQNRPPPPPPAPRPPDRPRAPAPPPKEEKPQPKQPPEFPPPPLPDPDPRVEGARQLALGKEAFAAGEYGRAAHRFRQALALDPAEPMGHFLLAQALVGLGKYDQAADAIQTGLRLDPTWPSSRFRPLDLYDDNVADYAEHLTRLEQSLEQDPADPVLLFLYAHQLWFDGREDEALPLFQRAAQVAPDRTAIDRFLLVRPPGVPLV